MTRDSTTPAGGTTRVLFIGHDATRTGAPIVLLDILRWLKHHTDLKYALLLERGGALAEEYRAVCPVWVLQSDVYAPGALERCTAWIPKLGPRIRNVACAGRAQRLRETIAHFRPTLLYANTVATRRPVDLLAPLRLPLIVHAHELEMWIRTETGITDFASLAGRASRFIAASSAVASNFVENHGIAADDIDVVPSFTDASRVPTGSRASRRLALCQELNIDPHDVAFVGAVGTIDWRKGTDLFAQLAGHVIPQSRRPTHFIWLGGDPSNDMCRLLEFDLRKMKVHGHVHFLGSRPEAVNYIDLLDVFVLTSREDPFPLVMLEAGAMEKPIVCFAQSGGAPEFVADDAGFVVPYLDVRTMAERVLQFLDDAPLRARLGGTAAHKVRTQYDVAQSGQRIADIIERVAHATPTSRVAERMSV